jgi:signal transduction histidine kinase
MEQPNLKTLAKSLSFDGRRRTLSSVNELHLLSHIRDLLMAMEPTSIVEITHGVEELGKDLVVVSETKFGKQVIGIVVKTGAITGETMGKVDEIASQVEQCFQHPAILRTVEGPLAVREVWVIIAGEFTTKGQQRLGASTKNRNVRLFDIKWLVDRFTEYYPQVFFENIIRESERELEESITLISHALSQYLDGIRANCVYLERLAQVNPLPIQDIIVGTQEIDSLASVLEGKVKALYYSTLISRGKNIEYRFDRSFSLVDLLERCRNRLIFYAQKKDVMVRIDRVFQALPDIFADQDMMELVFDNLIENAIKYSNRGTEVSMIVRYSSEEEKFRVTINNVGFGIPADEKDRIFLGFGRSHIRDPRRPISGTGMGLMVARKVVTDHGGTIEVLSKKEGKEYDSSGLGSPSEWEGFNTSFAVTLSVRPNIR